jgi:pimeloyl-ACP methyl ester carboxylesterase
LLSASAAAYAPSGNLVKRIEERSTETMVDIRCGEKCVVVAFRGTADVRNWLTDLDCQKEEYVLIGHLGQTSSRLCGFHVHAGFLEAWLSVKADLLDCLLDHRGKKMWITGHSLGGALAQLAALDLFFKPNAPSIAGVYTFGQPRVGNAAFAAFYNDILKDQSYRVVHANDIVPRVPWLLNSYCHAGHEVFYPPPRDGETPFIIDLGRLAHLLADARGMWRTVRHGQDVLISDHFVANYVKLFSAVK